MSSPKIRVLAVNASPRKYGNTFKLLKVAVEAARREGAEVEVVHLYDYEIKPCIGCLSDIQDACRYPCVFNDGGRELIEKVYRSEVLIVGTPVYWYGPTGHLKNFIDRITCLENMIFIDGKSWAEGKVAGFIAVGADSGNISTIAYLMVVLNSMGFIIPPWALAYYIGTDDALEKHESVSDAANVGALAVRMAKLVRGVGRWYDAELTKELGGENLIKLVAVEADKTKSVEFAKREHLITKSIREEKH